jgi:hypothetical protein
MTFWSTLQFLIFCGTVFEVPTVAVIHYAFWVRSVTAWYIQMFWSTILGLSFQAIGRYRQYALTKTSVPTNVITLSYNFKTKHLNLNILLFPCIISLFIANQQHAHIRQKVCLIVVHYISTWAEVSRSNIMYSKKILCRISVCSWFAIILNFAISRADVRIGRAMELRKWYCRWLLCRYCT